MAKEEKKTKAPEKKKTTGKKQPEKTKKVRAPENALPQNIMPMGERVLENKNIYIYQPVYKLIHKFTKNKTTDESGGMLLGKVVEDMGKTNIIITGFVEAKYCEATPTTLKFTHETWEYVHGEIDKKHPGKKIVGWIHTHPDFGIFLSEYDTFIHENFFGDENQIAYVIDPIQHEEGFYFWIDGKLERCKGFYVFDKTGVEISVAGSKDAPVEKAEEKKGFNFKDLLIAVMAIAVVFLIFSNISTNNRVKELEQKQEELIQQQDVLVESTNLVLGNLVQMIEDNGVEIDGLTEILTEAGLIEEPTEPSVPDTTTDATEGSVPVNE